MDEKKIAELALEGIRKKLLGKSLNYKEIFAIMDEISQKRMTEVLTTYFVASGYSNGFTNEEIYYLTRAMVETGEQLEFKGIVADKHSIGGTPGTRVTMIVVPIIAAAGFKIPKSSSRAITTPAGTADSMEVISKVTFSKEEIYEIVEKTNACIVWGGGFKIAPADDEIIRIEAPLMFESFDKILVSVMAKKIAFGATHVVIDIPYGKTVKVKDEKDGKALGKKFKDLAARFDIKLYPFVHQVDEPAGRGIGPLLEAKDALLVLEQEDNRPLPLEERALHVASLLLDLCLEDAPVSKKEEFKAHYKTTLDWAKDILVSGKAQEKMKEIIHAQKGNAHITSSDLKPAHHRGEVVAPKSGKVRHINNKNITLISKILGTPNEKDAGIYIYKRIHDEVEKGDKLFTMYSQSAYRIREAIDSLDLFPIYDIA